MDTVNMLNTMRFYCQPILPLVYDESMSYYETLCKVVGQLNTTGETVNKLNEGLTAEIADRQAGDAALDERLKKIEETDKRIHFLVFEGASPMSVMPTRSELYNWVRDGDAIFTLFHTDEEGRGQIYAASCSYNAGNWGSEASNDFNIIVPIETTYDAGRDYAVKQKVAKLAIPLSPQTNLNSPWRLQIIEVNTPSTSAEGVVNLVAVINDSDSVNCSLTPSEFLGLYNMTRGGKNICVAVNAKLLYDALARSSSIATVDTVNRVIRIAFEREGGVYEENGVKQLNKTFDYLIGDAKTNAWTHEFIDSRTLDFNRYEGFQFTRGANNVITANDESTPNAVWAQYKSDASGKIYQNLPVRLIDTVDNAEYWNGTFDIYDNKHMTFTFVTSNYATASYKMLVRVIELSADTDTTTWKYGVKEFSLPLETGEVTTYVDFWPTGDETYDSGVKGYTVTLGCSSTYEAIFALIQSGKKVVARLYQEAEKTNLLGRSVYYAVTGNESLGTINFQFIRVGSKFLGFDSIADYILLVKTSTSTQIFATVSSFVLPTPNGDGTDNGKVPTVNGTKWELKAPSGGASDFVINGTINDDNSLTTDKTYAQIQEAVQGGKRVTLKVNRYTIDISLPLIGENDTDYIFEASLTVFPAVSLLFFGSIGADGNSWNIDQLIVADSSGNLGQISMDRDPEQPMEIATKQYVDTHAGGAGFKYLTYDAMTASADMTPAEVRAFIAANPHMPVYMIVKNLGTNLPPAWGALQGATSSDGVLAFVATVFSNNSGNQKYIVVTSVSDTAWSTVNQRYLLSEVLPSLSAPSFYTSTGTPVFGVTEDSIIAKADGPYMRTVTGDDVVNGESYVGLGLKRIYFETGDDASTDDIYKVVGRDSILCDIAFVLGRVILDGSAEGTITGYNTDVYAQILREINYGRCSIWLKFNGETIRVASWKQTGSGAYTLTFFGAGAAAQPVKYVVTASASAASLAVTGS